MEPKIAEIFTFTDNAKELWESVRDMYSQQNNVSRIYQLKKNISETKQGDKPFVEYMGILKTMWDELSHYQPSTTDLKTLQLQAEEDKILQLLANLKPEYESVRSQILMKAELPSFNTVCAIIQQEEVLRKATNSNIQPNTELAETSALAIIQGDNASEGKAYASSKNKGKGKPKCDHCQGVGHIKDKC